MKSHQFQIGSESYTVEWSSYKVKVNGTVYKLRKLPIRRVLWIPMEYTLPIPNANVLLVMGMFSMQLVINGVNVQTGKPYEPIGKIPAWAYVAMVLDITLALWGALGVVFGILGIFMTSRVIASSQMKNGTKIVLSFGYPILVWVFLFLAFFVAGMAAAVATMGAVG